MVKARISLEDMRALAFPIIPYQVITGNYDTLSALTVDAYIIPYQVITGNYDGLVYDIYNAELYHTK